jgi:N-methylhydantoinase A/oxoprolinase/acetone carboxylase beta subunit
MVSSIGLGGGSVVSRQQPSTKQQQQQWQQQQQQQQCCQVGPLSVGSAVTSSSLVAGGTTLTASDVAVMLHDRLPGLKRRADVPPAMLAAADSSLLQDAWEVSLLVCLAPCTMVAMLLCTAALQSLLLSCHAGPC